MQVVCCNWPNARIPNLQLSTGNLQPSPRLFWLRLRLPESHRRLSVVWFRVIALIDLEERWFSVEEDSLHTMKTNVGGWDRNLCWIVGTGALMAGVFAPLRLPLRLGLLAFGASELITASTRYCPVNEMLGVNTTGEGLKSDLKSAAQSLVE